MQKKDLKSKMVVKCRNGNFYLVVDDVLVKENGFNLISGYSENLLMNGDDEFDIMEIFKIINGSYSFTNDLGMTSLEFDNIGKSSNLKSIWKRTLSYDGEELVEGNKVWIVSDIGGMSFIYNFSMKEYNEDYKYFVTQETALKYIEFFESPLFSMKEYLKHSSKIDFKGFCESRIENAFLKAIVKL